MFLKGGKNRVGAAVLAVALAMALAMPAGASPWGGWEEIQELRSGFLPRVLAWLGVGPDRNVVVKRCDDGATIDPNGCPKASGVLPTSRSGGMRADDGSRVDPVHRR